MACRVLRLAPAALAVFFLSACSLAEDITPPPGLSLTQTTAAPTAAAPVLPRSMPDAAAGRLIFDEHCAQCHGSTGRGDGPLAGQVRGQLPDFASPVAIQAHTPQELFAVITNGRLEKTMPPFGDSLSETQRWNVTAFLYRLSAPAEAIERGQAVFADRCAACHGPAGKGDGPEGDGALPDFTAPEFFALTSQAMLYDAVAGQVAPGAHTFSDALGEDERRAVAAFVRALGFTQEAPAAAAPGRLRFQGAVTNGTAGGSVPDSLPVTLHVFDRFQEIGVFTTTAAGGRYTFSDVPLAEEPFAVVTADYGGVGYASEVIELTGSETVIDVPLEVFETTTDPSAIHVQSWHIFFEMQSPGSAQVGELMVFSNEGDRTLVAPAAGGPTLEIPLPRGAEQVQFDDGVLGGRYLPTAEGFAHTLEVRPGPQALRVLVSFNLPMPGRLEFTQVAPYPAAAVDVFAPESVLRVASRQLSGPVPQDVEGTRYAIYKSTAPLPAGSTLALTVMPAGASANTGLLAAAGGLLLALAGLAAWWLLARRRKAGTRDAATDLETLVEALAQLDERFERGEYEEADYRRQRSRLKARAVELMKETEDES